MYDIYNNEYCRIFTVIASFAEKYYTINVY